MNASENIIYVMRVSSRPFIVFGILFSIPLLINVAAVMIHPGDMVGIYLSLGGYSLLAVLLFVHRIIITSQRIICISIISRLSIPYETMTLVDTLGDDPVGFEPFVFPFHIMVQYEGTKRYYINVNLFAETDINAFLAKMREKGIIVKS
jgi:hypothetical protein